MIDIHSHILPGVDDGAVDLQESLALLDMAQKDGVTEIILTPHLDPLRGGAASKLRSVFSHFSREAALAGSSITLRLAAEIMLDPELIHLIDSPEMLWLGHDETWRYFLMEFPPMTIPAGTLNLVAFLEKKAIRPVIAHPERNMTVMSNPDAITPLVKAGCLLQVTAGSLTGVFGEAPIVAARTMLKKGQVSFIASDCHDAHFRSPRLREGVEAAAAIVGHDEAQAMVSHTPRSLLLMTPEG